MLGLTNPKNNFSPESANRQLTNSSFEKHEVDPSPASAEAAFQYRYPEYAATSHLDELRATEYARLDKMGQIYLDYTGGPHVIFGWGNTCVDDLVTAFLVEDQLPPLTETVCKGNVAAEFVNLAPPDAAEFESPLEALFSVDNEIYYLPEYYYWDLETPTTVGCPFGGMLTYQPSDVGEAFALTDCVFSTGFVMSGESTYNYDQELFTLNVTVNGLTNGTLTYTRDVDGARHVNVMYAWQAVDLSAQE